MRILIVEDEAKIAGYIADSLDRAGYVCATAGDGEAACDRALADGFDGIVLDLALPKLDGLTVVRRLRKAGIATPIVVVSARGTWMERVEGIDAGADDYLPKPFHAEELVARLGAVIRRAGSHATPRLEAAGGRLSLDTRRKSIRVGGEAVDLTPLEFRATRYLAHHKGETVSRSELAEHVYEGAQDRDSNALEVLIARLRKKLGGDMIATRRGLGYLIPE
jgi:DNA-binding response OmpR family regulator